MEVFFNELSVRPASSDAEAHYWIEVLADLLQLLQKVVESISDDQFTFRRNDEFGILQIRPSQTIYEFVHEHYEPLDKEYVLLISLFSSPCISEDDPQRSEFEYTSLEFAGEEQGVTGLAAAYLKNALAISFGSDPIWDKCHYTAQINRLDATHTIVSSSEPISHASQKQHILDCHLNLLANLFNWQNHHLKFDSTTKIQTILSLIGLYSLHVESWPSFYNELSQLNEGERVASINVIAEKIANVQRWQPATGGLKNQNSNRTIYTIPNSDFIVSVDTQHGEFEIHKNQKGNNHLGSLSFDGRRFKPAISNRSLKI
ncbi:hypothetical protein GCM10028807_09390 [Spirosoma daeguense]